MVNESSKGETESGNHQPTKAEALQNQLGNMLSGVERSLAVTCDSIMGKMKQLEDKIQDMEKRYTELTKDAERALREAEASEKVQNPISPSEDKSNVKELNE